MDERSRKEIAKESRHFCVCLSVSCESSKQEEDVKEEEEDGERNEEKETGKEPHYQEENDMDNRRKRAFCSGRFMRVAIWSCFTREQSHASFLLVPFPALCGAG